MWQAPLGPGRAAMRLGANAVPRGACVPRWPAEALWRSLLATGAHASVDGVYCRYCTLARRAAAALVHGRHAPLAPSPADHQPPAPSPFHSVERYSRVHPSNSSVVAGGLVMGALP